MTSLPIAPPTVSVRRLHAIAIGLVVLSAAAHLLSGAREAGQAAEPDTAQMANRVRRIRSVTFEGRTVIPEDALLEAARLRPGVDVSADLVEDARRRLLAHPWVADVGIPVIQAAPDGLVDIAFPIRERPTLAGVRFEGCAGIPSEDLLEGLDLGRGGPLKEAAVDGAREAIIERYHREGFLLASVKSAVEPAGGGRVNVIFSIEEGAEVTVTEVTLEGAQGLPASDVLGRLSLRADSLLLWLSEDLLGPEEPGSGVERARPYYVPEKVEGELDKVRAFYRERGFLSADAGIDGIEFDDSFEKVRVRLRVREGPRYTIAAARVEGSRLFSPQDLAGALDLPTGGYYCREEVERAKHNLFRWYTHRSERLPTIRDRTELGEGDQVTVVFEIVDEKFVRVGPVTIRGNTLTRDRVVRSRVTLVPGDLFSPDELQHTAKRLEGTGYLGGAEIGVVERPDLEDPDTVIADVDLRVTEKEYPGLLSFQGTADSGLGAIGGISVHHSNFDLFRLPGAWDDWTGAFRGGGQRLDLEFLPGTSESYYSFRFEEPYFFRSDLALSLFGGISVLDRESYDETRPGGSAELRKYFDREHLWSAALSWTGQDVRVHHLEDDAPADVIAAEGTTLLSYPRLEIRYDGTEPNFYSGLKGFVASLRGDLSYKAFGSEMGFARAVAAADYYLDPSDLLSIFDGRPDYRHILHAGLRCDWMDGVGGDEVLLFERFYLGGPRSFRGFEYRGLGPHQGDTPVGGQGAIHGTAEYSFPLYWRELRAIAFFDWGDLEPSFSQISTGRFRTAVGGGLQIRLQLLPGQFMPVNLYWTHALSADDDDETEVFSFSVGVSF